MWRSIASRAVPALLACALATAASAAPYNTKRIDEIPDFTQYDPQLGLPNGGRNHCAVVAAANALVWLADRKGFKRLLPVRGVTVMDRVSSVVQSLSSDKYMATRLGDPLTRGGTPIRTFVTGLEKYLEDAGYRGRIRYQGVWGAPKPYEVRRGAPESRWMARRFERGDAVWVVLRFYEDDRRGGLKPAGAHMVTMVGYGIGADGRHAPEAIVIRDPAAGEEPHFLELKPRREGHILDRRGKRLKNARGFPEVVAGYPYARGRIVLLEEVLALEL